MTIKNVDDIWERIEKLPLLIGKITSKDQSALSELAYLWLSTTGKTLRWDCRDCRHRAYTEVTSFTYQKLKTMSERKFQLKETALIQHAQEHFDNGNITDEKAREILKFAPSAIDSFAVYPKDADGNLDLSVEKSEKAKK